MSGAEGHSGPQREAVLVGDVWQATRAVLGDPTEVDRNRTDEEPATLAQSGAEAVHVLGASRESSGH